jgi:hypothetical protein
MANFAEIIGMPQGKPDKRMKNALILHLLASLLLEDDESEDEAERAVDMQEIRVRPRIEPLGG